MERLNLCQHTTARHDAVLFTVHTIRCYVLTAIKRSQCIPRIAEHQNWMETNSRFAQPCPDLDDGMEAQDPPVDLVNHPPHYKSASDLEAIEVIEAFAADNYHRAAALKYLLRGGKKDDTSQDLKKAIWYIEREISRL